MACKSALPTAVDVGPTLRPPVPSTAASPSAPPLSSTKSATSNSRLPIGLRGVTAPVCLRLVSAMTYAPRERHFIASSTGTVLRPELEMAISTSPAFTG